MPPVAQQGNCKFLTSSLMFVPVSTKPGSLSLTKGAREGGGRLNLRASKVQGRLTAN